MSSSVTGFRSSGSITFPSAAMISSRTGPISPVRLPLGETAPEPERVLDGVALPVVVEVRVDVDLRPPRSNAPLPLLELALGVVPAAAAVTVVEANERPVRGELVRLEGPLGVVTDHERDAAPA